MIEFAVVYILTMDRDYGLAVMIHVAALVNR